MTGHQKQLWELIWSALSSRLKQRKLKDLRDSSISFQTFEPNNLILNLPQLVLIIGKAEVDLDAKRVLYLYLKLIGAKKLLKAFGRLDFGEMVHETCSIEKDYIL